MAIRTIFVTLIILLGSVVLALAQPVDHLDTGSGGIEQGKQVDGASNLITATSYQLWLLDGWPLEDMSSGTTELIAGGADNDNSAMANLGFVFRFDGGFYTTFAVNANGVMKLGTAMSGPNNVNSINSVAESPKIAPFWDDLCVGSGGKVHYKNVVSGGIRKLIVEWKNMKISRGAGCDGTGSGTFQVWLYDRPGVVQFVYGSGIGPTLPSDGGYSVGLQFNTADNFASVTTATNTANYTVPNNGQTNAITQGRSYYFRPIIPDTPTGGLATVTDTTATLSWTDYARNESAYLVRRTTDHVNFYFIGFLGANANSFTDSGLTPSTQYYYYVNALSEGAFSDDLVIPALTIAPGSAISSTATGGNWSSPSTWVGGVVPTEADDVTIAPGGTVVVDTNARAGNVTVGSQAGAPARLTFQETTAWTLTTGHNVNVEANGDLSTGAGTVNTHILKIGGDLINKGTLDLSTNGGQAGAAVDFTGNLNATFGGNGPVTDISRIMMDKASVNNIVELAPSNFTVNGTTTEGPASGFLDQNGGTFKISGTFTGAHRTFSVDNYYPPASAGFWLDNPNYTVTASGQSGILTGGLRMTAGEFNKGISVENSLVIYGSFIMEGGRLNVSGGLGINAETRVISGGKITVCKATGGSCGLFLPGSAASGPPLVMSGGEIVVQNSAKFYVDGSPTNPPLFTGGLLRIGSDLSSGPGIYEIAGSSEAAYLPDTVIDTSSGFTQTVFRDGQQPLRIRNLTINPGGVLKARSLSFNGASVINNGQLEIISTLPGSKLEFDDLTGLSDITYSGTGIFTGTAASMNVRCRNMIFDQVGENLFSYNLKVTTAHIVNSGRITLGRHDSTETRVEIYDGASLDVSPVFDLGPLGQKITYGGTNTTGPEINSTRILMGLTFIGPGTLTLGGGDLAVLTIFFSNGGVIKTGAATLSTQLTWGPVPNGYVDGNLRTQLIEAHAGHVYCFPVGQNGASTVFVNIQSVTGPSALTIRAVDMTLPGLDPTVSASRYWTITEEGSVTGGLELIPNPADINGNPANYITWRSNGGTPVPVTTGSIDQLTGDWGRGAALAPASVSVSGTVTNSTGQPIRNALMTISGGGLPAPVTTSTGNLGTYAFSGLTTGGTFTVQVSAKRYRFTPSSQMVTANNDVGNVNFAANPQE